MRRSIARWALRFLGLALGLGGAAAMLCGWDIVQVERGWSLFIAGASALSGGAVVIALAEVVARLDRLLAETARAAADAMAKPAPSAQTESTPTQPTPAPQIVQKAAPPPPPEPKAAPAPTPEPSALQEPHDHAPEPRLEAGWAAPAPTTLGPPAPPFGVRRQEASAPVPITRSRPQAATPTVEEPREIERYQSGGLTYVMFSDGSVELRSEAGAQRYSSIEELRAVLATQE